MRLRSASIPASLLSAFLGIPLVRARTITISPIRDNASIGYRSALYNLERQELVYRCIYVSCPLNTISGISAM
jgi:hypothetical protein